MKKKFIWASLVSLAILSSPLSFSYAKSELVEWRALSLAHQYIENSLSDEAWAGNNPVISAQSKFYTDDAKKVSYIEYKVTCDSSPDCGFIMMNVDGNDVSVPIASPTGNTPSEILDQGNDVSEKFYYFGPFDLYSENEVTGDVQALNPQLAVDLRDDTQMKRSKEEKEANKLAREALKTKLKKAKLAAKEFKKSEEFKKQKEEIKDQILNVPKEEFSMKILDMGYAANYTSPWLSNVFIPGWDFTTGCYWQTPCYNQFQQNYNGTTCYSWCGPTALGIIFWYYDRNGFPNLLTWTAPRVNSTDVNTMINSLRSMMLTNCNGGNWTTNDENIKLGIKYAKDKGYSNATSSYSWSLNASTTFAEVKTEVNAGRPIIITITDIFWNNWHVVVAHGYKSSWTSNIVRMNMWWGWTSSTFNWFYTSNVDQNLGSIYFGSSNSHRARAVTKVKMN